MKTSRIIQFVLAAVLFSIGCLALLTHAPIHVSTLCLCLPSVVMLRRSEATRQVPLRELWIMIAVSAALVVAFILAAMFIPDSAAERFIRRTVFVVPLWALFISALFWQWRRESQRAVDA